jgi:hypothetical protein
MHVFRTFIGMHVQFVYILNGSVCLFVILVSDT